jgi:Family of unknown function (DUF5706)
MLKFMNSGSPPPRGFDNAIATFFRTVQTHHVALSQMADQKANVLIAASFVVISIIFHESTRSGFTPVLAALAATCFCASFLAAMAILPRAEKPKDAVPNPLFFGTFATLSREDFHHKIDEILTTDQSIIHAMAEDIYQLGSVLHRHKYRYLRHAYRTFLGGLTLTAATAVWQVVSSH